MRIMFALIVVTAAAAGVTTVFVAEPSPSELAVVSKIEKGGIAQLTVRGADQGKASSGAETATSPLSRFFGYALPPAEPQPAAVKTQAQAEPAQRSDSRAWSTDVVVYPGAREPSADAVLTAAASVVSVLPSAAKREEHRPDLIRDLQRELKRVGCYFGEIDGDWGAGSKRSLRAFMERANSTLQSETPDMIVLTLVKGHTGIACRSPQAPNGAMTAGAVPPAPVAAARPLTTAPVAAFTAAPALAPASTSIATGSVSPLQAGPALAARPPNFDGRMAVGGPPSTQPQAPPPPVALTAPPVVSAPPARAQRRPVEAQSNHRPQRQATQQRRDRGWTANFFNQ